jgi:alpha-ketoglutarate-dependent taurine dioxygenase
MTLEIRELRPEFGAEVLGFEQALLDDAATRRELQALFDAHAVLVFRDLDLDHPSQVRLTELVVRRDGQAGVPREDTWYISNKRPASAAPWGRLQFHSDMMWSDQPCEVISLYGLEVEPPVVPTTFVSTTRAWATLPDALRAEVEGRRALHTMAEIRRGPVDDVLVTVVEHPRTTVQPLGFTHPQTGATLLYACEQMTQEIVGLDHDESEALLGQVFAHLYEPSGHLNHEWQPRDLVVWDNLACQHARPNVTEDSPARTLRKVASPMPTLAAAEKPVPTTVS